MPLEMRTPLTDAFTALSLARTVWSELASNSTADNLSQEFAGMSSPDEYFVVEIFGKAFENPETNGKEQAGEIGLTLDGKRDPNFGPCVLVQVLCTVVAYGIQAIKAEERGCREEAWALASDARYWGGVLIAQWAGKEHGEASVADNARKAALASHAEDYAIAKDLEAWHIANRLKFTTFDAAAIAAIKEVPFVFRTARKHIVKLSKTYPLHAKGKPRM